MITSPVTYPKFLYDNMGDTGVPRKNSYRNISMQYPLKIVLLYFIASELYSSISRFSTIDLIEICKYEGQCTREKTFSSQTFTFSF